jgi:hypothetical protein
MEPEQLYEPPFTDNAQKGPDEFFDPAQMKRLVEVISGISGSAGFQTA